MTKVLYLTAFLATTLLAACDNDASPIQASRHPTSCEEESTAFAPVKTPEAFPGMPPEVVVKKERPSHAVQEAQRQLDLASEYIKDNQLDQAEKVLTELDKIRDKLPTESAIRLDQTRTNVDFLRFGSHNR